MKLGTKLKKRRSPRKPTKDLVEIVKELDRKYPLSADTPFHNIDTTDRRALAKYIREKILRKRER